MRVIAFVSLALALAVSSMPLPGNDASSTPKGVVGEVSQLGGKVKSAAANIHAPEGLGSRAVPLGGLGTVVGVVEDAIGGAKGKLPRSSTANPDEVKSDVSGLEGKVKLAVAGVHPPKGLGARTIPGGLSSAGGIVDKAGKAAGAAEKDNGAAELISGAKGGVSKVKGATSKLGGVPGIPSGTGSLAA